MKLNNSERSKLFHQARAINPELGDTFQNEMHIHSGMVDDEFEKLESFQLEINNYRDHLNRLKDVFG